VASRSFADVNAFPSATDTLSREHVYIKAVCGVLYQFSMKVLQGQGKVEDVKEDWNLALDFLVNYADGVHHAKEEDILFPALEEAGIPVQQGPIGVMLQDHTVARKLVREMRSALEEDPEEDPGVHARLIAAARSKPFL